MVLFKQPSTSDWSPEVVDVAFGDCLCVHSVGHMITSTLEHILFERQIVPSTVAQLMNDVNEERTIETSVRPRQDMNAVKFVNVFEKLITSISQSFRSALDGHVHECAITLGQTHMNPYEMYRIRYTICSEDHDGEGVCHMEKLGKHTRKMNAQLMRSQMGHSFKKTKVNVGFRRCTFALYASRSMTSKLQENGFTMKDAFSLRDEAQCALRSTGVAHISLEHGDKCPRDRLSEEWPIREADKENAWFVFDDIIQGFQLD